MMKKVLIFLFTIQLSAFSAFAQSKEEAAVAAAVETLRKALVDADKAALENIAAEALDYGHSNGKVEDKAEFVRAIVSGESDFVTIDITDQKIQLSGNAAVVRHKLSGTTNNKGQAPGTVKLGVLQVWQKQKGGWKLLARQAVKI